MKWSLASVNAWQVILVKLIFLKKTEIEVSGNKKLTYSIVVIHRADNDGAASALGFAANTFGSI